MDETDLELLRRYAQENAEDAFAEIVRRHLGLVHSAALRQVRSAHLAEEVSQSVFIDVARNAKRLTSKTIPVAWLYEVTRRTAIDVVRRESRRELREQTAHELETMNSTEPAWTEVEPLLEDAMATLEPADRTAVLLRYFENKSLREVGETLGTSENAAQKRISRAVERLHRFFRSKGVSASASGLTVLISANAVQAVPFQFGTIVTTTAIQAGAATITNVSAAAINTLIMTTTQKVLIATAFVAALGTGLYQAREASRLRTQLRDLEAQFPLASNIKSVTRERDEATNKLAALRVEIEQLKRNNAELMRLRAEVTRLKSDANATGKTTTGNPVESAALEWLGRVNLLKERVARTPEANVPEMRLLNAEDWLSAVQEPKLETEKDYRRAMSALRNRAQNKFAANAEHAVHKFMKENNGAFPTDVSQLLPYFDSSVDPDILQRFSIVPADSISGVKLGGEWAISQNVPVDEEFDSRFVIGPNGYGSTTWRSENIKISADVKTLTPVIKAFVEANGGRAPANLGELQPFLKTQEEQQALQRVFQVHTDKEIK